MYIALCLCGLVVLALILTKRNPDLHTAIEQDVYARLQLTSQHDTHQGISSNHAFPFTLHIERAAKQGIDHLSTITVQMQRSGLLPDGVSLAFEPSSHFSVPEDLELFSHRATAWMTLPHQRYKLDPVHTLSCCFVDTSHTHLNHRQHDSTQPLIGFELTPEHVTITMRHTRSALKLAGITTHAERVEFVASECSTLVSLLEDMTLRYHTLKDYLYMASICSPLRSAQRHHMLTTFFTTHAKTSHGERLWSHVVETRHPHDLIVACNHDAARLMQHLEPSHTMDFIAAILGASDVQTEQLHARLAPHLSPAHMLSSSQLPRDFLLKLVTYWVQHPHDVDAHELKLAMARFHEELSPLQRRKLSSSLNTSQLRGALSSSASAHLGQMTLAEGPLNHGQE